MCDLGSHGTLVLKERWIVIQRGKLSFNDDLLLS